MKYTLRIDPVPTPRPRVSKFRTYYPVKYTKYKDKMINMIQDMNIPFDDYSILTATFFVPYAVSIPNKKKIDGAPHRIKFDCDNLVKGLSDCLQIAGVFKNDSQISTMNINKVYTTDTTGRIEFELL